MVRFRFTIYHQKSGRANLGREFDEPREATSMRNETVLQDIINCFRRTAINYSTYFMRVVNENFFFKLIPQEYIVILVCLMPLLACCAVGSNISARL